MKKRYVLYGHTVSCTMKLLVWLGLKLWVEKVISRVIIRLRSANLTIKNKGGIVMKRDDISSLAHSKWNCKYHVVFAPKYRRMVIYN